MHRHPHLYLQHLLPPLWDLHIHVPTQQTIHIRHRIMRFKYMPSHTKRRCKDRGLDTDPRSIQWSHLRELHDRKLRIKDYYYV